jgi:hypothetical protein
MIQLGADHTQAVRLKSAEVIYVLSRYGNISLNADRRDHAIDRASTSASGEINKSAARAASVEL